MDLVGEESRPFDETKGCGFIDGYGQSKGIEPSGLLQISVYWVYVKTPSDGNSQHLDIAETTLQRCFFLHQFLWLDIGWNECQGGCAKSAGDLESDQRFSNWPRDLISGYAYFVCILSIGRLLRHYWSKKFGHGFCVAWRILARPRWPVHYRSGRRTRHHAFTCLCKSFSSCLSLKKHDMREVSREQHQIIKWKLNWLATSCYKEGFIVYSLRGASSFHFVAAASIKQRF